MEDYSNELLNLMIRYHNLLLRYHHQMHRGHGPFMDTMRGQGRVLSILKMTPEITQKELAYLLDMRVQSLSELLSKLEGKGYITRTPSEADRRVMVIRLTEEGAAAVQNTTPPDVDKPFQCLNEEEQETLRKLMERLVASMEEYLQGTTDSGRGFGLQGGGREERGFGFGEMHNSPPPHRQEQHGGFGNLFGRGFSQGFGFRDDPHDPEDEK